jgi:parallel beta-helix repeat protein
MDGRGTAAVLIVAFLILSSAAVLLMSGTETIPSRIAYNPHIPITIVSDADFAAQNITELWVGDGSALNPYQIRDYVIDATSSDTAISISNTRVHFVIDSCYLHNATTSQIRLTNVMNGSMVSNICLNGSYGIHLVNSRDNMVVENNCSFSERGVFLQSSSFNVVENNTCCNNLEYGIEVLGSGFDELINNTCIANQYYGMFVYNSNHITVDNNTCAGNYDKGIYVYRTTYSNITANLCLGNVLEGLYMDDADYNLVLGNSFWSNNDGVYMTMSSLVQIVANSCFWNSNVGIVLSSSDDDVLDWNNCSQNGAGGIYLESSNRDRVTNNTCSMSLGYGIRLYSSSSCVVDDNNCSDLSGYGVSVESSTSDLVRSNSLRMTNTGIDILQSSSMTISNNTISDCDYVGIHLNYTLRNRIIHNMLDGDGVMIDGNLLSHWNSHVITGDNTVNGRVLRYLSNLSGQTVPLGAGQVILANSNDTIVSGQNLSSASSGVEAGFCSRITITNSQCSNGTFGVRLYEVDDSIVSLNMLNWNRFDGARLVHVDSSTVNLNNMSGNLEYGLRLQSSLQNNIVENQFSANTQYGVYLAAATIGNTIWNNSFAFNSGTDGTYDALLIQAFDQTGMNNWNSTGTPYGYGNYWYDWTTPDATPPTGIVDLPYNISGSAGSKDYFPLTTPPEPVIPIPEISGIVVAPLLAIVICALAWRRRTA